MSLLEEMFNMLPNKDKQNIFADYTFFTFEDLEIYIQFEFNEIKEMKKCCKDCSYLIQGKDNEWCCDLRKNLTCRENYLNCLESEDNNV